MAETEEKTGREKVLDRRRKVHEAIRQAAIDEFAANGFSGTSTQAIATRAGLTKAQLHYYISSKEELYEKILLEIMDEWRDIFFISSSEGEPEKVIREYIRKKLEFGWKQPNASRVFSNEVAAGAPFLRKHWLQSLHAAHDAASIFQSWIDRKLILPVDPLLFQVHMWAVTQHYADFGQQVRVMVGGDEQAELDREHIVEEVSTLFLRACGIPAKTGQHD
ncbi:TetR family transcriptional regulator C-terminal domain-containing protein [Mesorhizobium sp. 1B3]|uniref:TetR family transcriptional regulator C-terminal domain-containing protein n=1 Tax=Mesorhizobium sp. 1B3 TaxID=3243599 RepID=UPI003D97577F